MIRRDGGRLVTGIDNAAPVLSRFTPETNAVQTLSVDKSSGDDFKIDVLADLGAVATIRRREVHRNAADVKEFLRPGSTSR